MRPWQVQKIVNRGMIRLPTQPHPHKGELADMFSLRKSMVSLSLLACAFVMLSFLSPHALAASPWATSYSFLIIQNGQVTHSWGGPQSNRAQHDKDLQSMTEIQHALLASQPTSSTTGERSSLAVLPNIHQATCGTGDYLILTDTVNNQFCYGDAGTLTIDLFSIKTLYTGNNEANFSWFNGINSQFFLPGDGNQLCKHDNVSAGIYSASGAFYEVLFISITNPTDPCEFK